MSAPPWMRMRLSLDRPAPAPVWPDGVRPVAFTDERAGDLHATLVAAFAGRADAPPAFAPWWEALRRDAEFDPALCLLAQAGGDVAGAAQGWTSGYLKDLGVRPAWRRSGLGRAMLLHVAGLFRAQGVEALDLKVMVANAGAISLYERVGFERV